MTFVGRREAIMDACLVVVARDGVAGASHRKVATEAHVPLGSMTYHFNGIRNLLHESFERFATVAGTPLESAMAKATTPYEAIDMVAQHIADGIADTRGELVITQELYTIAARDPSFRDITERWMQRSRTALERHFLPHQARAIDALIEGLVLHGALDVNTPTLDDLREQLTLLTFTLGIRS